MKNNNLFRAAMRYPLNSRLEALIEILNVPSLLRHLLADTATRRLGEGSSTVDDNNNSGTEQRAGNIASGAGVRSPPLHPPPPRRPRKPAGASTVGHCVFCKNNNEIPAVYNRLGIDSDVFVSTARSLYTIFGTATF